MSNRNETRQSTLFAIQAAVKVVSNSKSIQEYTKNHFIRTVESVAKNYWQDLNFECEIPTEDPAACVNFLKTKLEALKILETSDTARATINSAIVACSLLLRELVSTNTATSTTPSKDNSEDEMSM